MVREWLEELATRGMVLSLESTEKALNQLGEPQLCAPAIHVAGSNGKGTACALISAALILSGHRVGTFTSPHLSRVEERIRIDGVPVSSEILDRQLKRLHHVVGELTFFEATWVAACLVFAAAKVDVMVVEVGLGGRLDATRTCNAMACLVTSISMEHSEILGHTISAIALEKAAIARPGIPLLMKTLAEGKEEVEAVHDVQWVAVDEADYREEAAVLAAAILLAAGFSDAAAMMPQALSRFRFPARMQRISREGREYLLDSAHNPSGMRRFVAMLEPLIEGTDWGLLFGSSPQLEMQAFLEPLIGLLVRQPAVDVVCTEPQGGRYPAVPASSFPFGRPIPEPAEAIIQLRGSLLVSCGSLYLQGNLLSILGLDSDQALSLL